jgi:hypothetical protein
MTKDGHDTRDRLVVATVVLIILGAAALAVLLLFSAEAAGRVQGVREVPRDDRCSGGELYNGITEQRA